MRTVLFTIVVFFTLAQNVAAFERIIHYHSDIYVQKNCEVLVHEKIKVYSEGINIKRGIFRDLPLSYKYKGGNVHVGFELLEIKRDGAPEPYHTENMSNGIRIYAGDKDVYLSSGEYTYEISYKVNHVLGFFDKYDEIYWNINGNGWAFSIDSISANVYYPEGAQLIQHDGYTGGYGDNAKNFITTEIAGGVGYRSTNNLYSEENLSISVAWNKNQVIYPTGWDEFIFWLESYILWVIALFGIVVGLLFNYRAWSKYGRDPKSGTIIPRFYPPEDFSPAECAYLKREGRQTNTMFGSELMSLAVKGLLKIEAKEEKGWSSDKTYIITRESTDTSKLNDIEKKFYSNLFGSKNLVVIKKGKYNARVASANRILTSNIDEKQKDVYYVRNNHLKGKQFVFPVITGFAGAICYFIYGGSIAVVVVGVVIHAAINIVFARLYEQPTKEGRKTMDEIAGFEMYMKYANQERIKLMNPPTMDFHHFEENLSYAIALGIADKWAGQFDPGEIKEFTSGHMPYYHGMMIGSFSNFSSELTSTISSASTPPSSSGSGSGGGGFSGGGGGGGGGGGW